MRRILITLTVLTALLGTALVADAAPGDAGLNARLIRWPYSDAIVHIVVPYGDAGTGGTIAYVPEYKQLLFGFEVVSTDLADLNTGDWSATVSIDSGPPIDVSDAFLELFYVTGSGPKWMWDHDADGRGDGNGNGVGDFPDNSWIAPFRYAHAGLAAGPHTFEFTFDFGSGPFSETVLFEMTS